MSFNSEMDREYMLRAIELAKKGKGFTNPNPLVGAVIVKDGRIIGEGYHAKYGELHAERNAIASLKESAEGAIIYVTLEPCPMCCWAILQSRIKTIYFGSYDRQYGGFSVLELHKLANSSINIYGGIMERECDKLLENFFNGIRR